jgi:hypothetical protein
MEIALKIRFWIVVTVFFAMWVMLASPSLTEAAIFNAYAHQSYTEGSYTEDQLHTYGSAVTTTVAAGGSYAGIGSTVIGVEDDPTATNHLGTTMELRDGTNTGAETTISMAWRTRTDIEVDGRDYPKVSQQYPPLAWDSYGNLSDAVELTGLQGPYVIEFGYSESAIIVEQTYHDEAYLAAHDTLYVGWFEDEAHKSGGNLSDQREWVRAIEGNSDNGNNPNAVSNYQGSYDSFKDAYGTGDPKMLNLTYYLSSYGVDTVNNEVWAILDHTSELAAIPEPATALLFAVGGLYFTRRRGR